MEISTYSGRYSSCYKHFISFIFQIYFDLGQVHFEREEYQNSIQCFNSCSHLLQDLNTVDHTWSYPTVDMDQLKGYLAACSSFDVEWIEQEEDDTFVVTAVEQFRKEKSVGQFHSFT